MKKIFKCFIVALIFSIAYAAMPSSVEAEVPNEFKVALRQANEKELEEISSELIRDKKGVRNMAEAISFFTSLINNAERKLEAEKKNLSKAEREEILNDIERAKDCIWVCEAVEQIKAELAEAKQHSLNAQKNSANNPKEKTFLDTAKEGYDEYQMRKQAEEREKARLAEAERQRKIREEEAKKREQEKKQKDKESFGEMIGFVVFVFIISLFMPGINFFIWIYLAIYIWQWING